MEQRKEIRTTVLAPVAVISGRLSYHELIQDISLDGAYIETTRKIPPGESLTLSFTFPSYPESIILPCRVVRSDPKGIGLYFTDVSSLGTVVNARQPHLPPPPALRLSRP